MHSLKFILERNKIWINMSKLYDNIIIMHKIAFVAFFLMFEMHAYFAQGQEAALVTLDKNYLLENRDKVIQRYTKALKKAEIKGNFDEMYRLNKSLGYAYYLLHQDSLALIHLNKALNLIESSDDLQEKAILTFYIGKLYSQSGQLLKSIDFFKESYKLYVKTGDTLHMFQTLQMLLIANQTLGNFLEALQLGKEMLQLSLASKNKDQHMITHFHFGQIYCLIDDLEKSFNHYHQALSLAQELADTHMMALTHTQLAELHKRNSRYNKAIYHYLNSYDLYHGVRNVSGMLLALQHIASIYTELKRYQHALNYLFRARNLAQVHNDGFSLFHIHQAIANIYIQQGNYPKALWYYDMNYNVAKSLEDPYFEVKSLYNLGVAQMQKGSIHKAREIFHRAHSIGSTHKNYEILDSIATHLFLMYQYVKEYPLAIEWLKKSKQYQAMASDERQKNYFKKIQSVFEYSTFLNELKLLQKKHELEKLEKENLSIQKKSLFIVIFLLIILLISLSIFLYILRRQNQILKMKGLEIEASNLALMQLNIQLQKKQIELDEKISELQKINKAIQESELNVKNKQNNISKVYSVISHDLRNLISAYYSIIRNTKRNFDAFDKNKLLDILLDLEKHTLKMNQLLDNLLQWSLFQSKGEYIKRKHISISSIVQNSILNFDLMLKNQHIDVELDIDAADVYVEEQMLQTVFRNLISNAIKSMPNGGVLRIIAKKGIKGIRFEIHDSGSGMPENVKKFVSSKFTNKYWYNKQLEIGFGLYICMEFLLALGSRLHVSDNNEKGTIVWFIIPYPKANG